MSLIPRTDIARVIAGALYPNTIPNKPNYHDWYICRYTPQCIEATRYDNYQMAKFQMNALKNDNAERKIIPIFKWSPEIYKSYKIKNEFQKDVKFV